MTDSFETLGRRQDPDRFGPYQVVEKIASGGMAEIYKARHVDRPHHLVALKCIRPDCDDDTEFRHMLMDEAKIASRLHHPNINRVLEVVEDGERMGLILQYVDGLDLNRLKRTFKERDEGFPIELAIHIIREVLKGLDYAHDAKDERGEYLNVVHRDISPGNVMIDGRGRVLLVDFGIARAQNRLAKTEAGNVKGKFRYMAPEQIKGDQVSPRTDVYATAVLLWELLAGKRIYDDVSVAQLMIRVANAHVPSLDEARPGLPRALHKVFQRATAVVPDDRYASARAFADALDGVLSQLDVTRCQRDLARLVQEARVRDGKARFDQAVARARYAAAEHDLEDAILSALEQPDRVERVQAVVVQKAEAHREAVIREAIEPTEPPTMPMGTSVRPRRATPPPLPVTP